MLSCTVASHSLQVRISPFDPVRSLEHLGTGRYDTRQRLLAHEPRPHQVTVSCASARGGRSAREICEERPVLKSAPTLALCHRLLLFNSFYVLHVSKGFSTNLLNQPIG